MSKSFFKSLSVRTRNRLLAEGLITKMQVKKLFMRDAGRSMHKLPNIDRKTLLEISEKLKLPVFDPNDRPPPSEAKVKEAITSLATTKNSEIMAAAIATWGKSAQQVIEQIGADKLSEFLATLDAIKARRAPTPPAAHPTA